MLLWLTIAGCAGRGTGAEPAPVAAPEATPAAQVAPVNACEAQRPDTWERCAGGTVTLAAIRQTVVPSAPLLQGPGQHQDYFEVDGRSLIVLTAAPIDCDAATFVGSLREHDLGGAPGTPMSWRGWVLDASTVTCGS